MHALNIMRLLNEVDRNTHISIRYVKTKPVGCIEISTKNLDYYIDEYGYCWLKYLDQPLSLGKDIEYWEKVKTWVKKYYQESF